MAFGDFTVVRSTVKNVLGSNGLIGQVAIDTPAFEFNTDGTYRGLLVEPGATNLLTYSQEFDNAAWTKTALTVTANTTVAPDGTTTADTATTTASTSELFHGSSTAATNAICSLFVKKSTHKYFGISINGANDFDSRYQGVFDLDLGAVFQENNSSTPLTNRVSKIEDYGNGWFRISVGATFATSANGFVVFQQSNNVPSIPSNNLAWNNSSIGSTFIWQAQLETGSVATSPIYTVASTVARTTDDISLTSASSLIGQTEGTIYLETNTRTVSTIADMVAVSGVGLYVLNISQSNGNIQLYSEPDMNLVVIKTGDNRGIPLKMAFAYMSGNFAFYVNGVQEWTSASVTPATSLDSISLAGGSNRGVSHHRSFALFPTRLSNSQLASLTTL
jgi:hypothetical protein